MCVETGNERRNTRSPQGQGEGDDVMREESIGLACRKTGLLPLTITWQGREKEGPDKTIRVVTAPRPPLGRTGRKSQ